MTTTKLILFSGYLTTARSERQSPGIGIHALDLATLKPQGKPELIYTGWDQKTPESKNVKKDGYYYLFTAEGGTGYDHNEAVARSKNIYGFTSALQKYFTLQRIIHILKFKSPDTELYLRHLMVNGIQLT